MNHKNLYVPSAANNTEEFNQKISLSDNLTINPLGLATSFSSPTKFFAAFKTNGTLLCLYPSSDTDPTEPVHRLVVSKMKDFEEEVDDSPSAFRIIFENNDFLEILAETEDSKEEWLSALRYLEEFYKTDVAEYTKAFESGGDDRITLRIGAGEELADWEGIKERFDYNDFIKDKQLGLLLELNLPESVKNRLALARADLDMRFKKSTEIDESRKIEEHEDYKLDYLEYINYHIVMLNPRPSYIVDREFSLKDNYIISKELIPEWMSFNTLYFFKYTSLGDFTTCKMALHIKDIISFRQRKINGKWGLECELFDRYFTLAFRFQWQVEMWLKSFEENLEYYEEIQRSVNKLIKHNIDLFYIYYKSIEGSQINMMLEEMIVPLNPEMSTDKFASELKEKTRDFNAFYDAIYAKKPFFFNALKFMSNDIHKRVRLMANDHWNANWKEMNAEEVIVFMNGFWFYLEIFKFWGITDSKLAKWITPLINTFVTKLFGNSKRILASILFDFRNNYKLIDFKIKSDVSDNIEQMINMIFDHFQQCPVIEVAEVLTSVVSTVLSVLFSNIKNFIKKENFPIEIYIGLLNNQFLRIVKSFAKKVHKETKKELSTKQIRVILDEEFLINSIFEIEKASLNLIKSYFQNEVRKSFFTGVKFPDYLFESFLREVVKDHKDLLDKIENEDLTDEVLSEILDQSAICYIKLFMEHANKIYSKDYDGITSKVKRDTNYLEKATDDTKISKAHNVAFKLRQLRTFLATTSIDKVIISISNMSVFYPDFNEIKHIEGLLKAKIFFPPESIFYISDYFRKSLGHKKRKTSSIMAKQMNATPMNRYVLLFVKRLSRLIRTSCCQKKTIE